MKPLAVDLCAGLGGWTDGLLAENWDVVGFDVERHQYGAHQYPAQLVLQDIRTLDGRQFRGKVSLIVASPPCQAYSYMAMPWTRAKALAVWYRDPEHPERLAELTALFDACVRIGREAECPIVIENVRGAQPWVGRSKWAFGSFHLWGDVPALMPIVHKAAKAPGQNWSRFNETGEVSQFNWATERATKNTGGSWFNVGSPGQKVVNRIPVHDGVKQGGDWFNAASLDGDGLQSISRRSGSKSSARKAASARIAKIPFPLAQHIARVYRDAARPEAA